MHTPDQARELWCPMVRVVHVPESSVPLNRIKAKGDTILPNASMCIADKCGMWRWLPGEGTHLERKIETETVAAVGGGVFSRSFEVNVAVPNAPTHGYCGLAGRPGAVA